jgi:hypothetical protein
MIVRLLSLLMIAGLLANLAGCKPRSALVYVLEEPQAVTLTTSASESSVQRGASVVLHVERRTTGKWKQIPLNEVRSGQCWVYQTPPESEPEVADSVHWEVAPENAVSFNQDLRLDHTKIATMKVNGAVTLTPTGLVKCEPERAVEGPAIRIEVS